MTPAKGQGSSCRKGKENASDDPATKNVDEEAPHSELKRSNKQEGCCDPDSECAPLIDPWYDTHTHFLKVSDKYLPPSLGRVWLSICLCNMEVSWALLTSSYFTSCAHSLRIWVGYRFGLERMGR